MAFAQDENRLSPYRKFLLDLSSHLSGRDLEALKFAALEFIPRRITENISSGLKFFDVLEQDGRITPQDLSLLVDMFKTVGRMDLAWKVQCFSTSSANVNAADDSGNANIEDEVTDGGGNKSKSESATSGNRKMTKPGMDQSIANVDDIEDEQDAVADGGGNESESGHADYNRMVELPVKSEDESQVVARASFRSDAVNNEALLFSAPDSGRSGQLRSFTGITTHKSSGGTNHGSSLLGTGPAPAAPTAPAAPAAPARTPVAAKYSQAPGGQGQQSRLQHDSSSGPPPVRYVNYLALEDYSVEIIGGKHFKTPEGEFVEMKSGTQYKIHVKNSRAYGCSLDISIDGYDVGGWVVYGGQELTIERPGTVNKLFTFYRVKTAPKEAGIESGRSENGVVKCVFTPEAFLNIPVVIPGLPQPIEVNMAPNAKVGDLKRALQSQLKATEDLDQILVLNEKVLSNFTRLSNLVISPGNLRLIDVELEITVETSSNVIFPIKIQPGKAKVLDLMDQIQRKLDVPIKDQKLYHGRSRLSDEPRRGLSQELICSFQPTVVVIVPEYILITVEDVISGDSSIVKIDKEKTLKDLVEEIPSCRNLPENKEAMFYYNGKELCPSRDDETLANLGIFSGSKLELKVKIIYIEINVSGYPGSLSTLSIGIRCNPQDTFKDLLNKLEARCNTGKLEGATFATGKRVFDPEQDQGPLQDYGIKHGSALVMKLAESQSNFEEGHAQSGVENGQEETLRQQMEGLEQQHLCCEKEDEGGSQVKTILHEMAGTVGQFMRNSYKALRRVMGGDKDEEQDLAYGDPAGAVEFVFRGNKCSAYGDLDDEVYLAPRAPRASHSRKSGFPTAQVGSQARILNANDPAWKAGGTTLQGHSTQQFMAADPIKVDHSKKIELVLRLVAREDETDLVFPEDEFQPLSTLYPPAVPE